MGDKAAADFAAALYALLVQGEALNVARRRARHQLFEGESPEWGATCSTATATSGSSAVAEQEPLRVQ